VGTMAVLGLLGGAPLIIFVVTQVRLRRAAHFKGPALMGTAQVLCAVNAGGLAAMFGVNTRMESLVRIGLRVQIPGFHRTT
jgi:hypothetical protein